MKTIASFQINHDTLTPGLYVSRIDGDAVTYDLRMKTPNQGDYLANPALHTLEHLLATYLRSSAHSRQIIYVGPMGCRTGFYIVARDSLSRQDMLALLRQAFAFAAAFQGEIPGAQRIQCGNYLEHDLPGCQREAGRYLKVLADCTVAGMAYPD